MKKIASIETLRHEIADAMQSCFSESRPLLNLTTQEVGEWLDSMICGEDCKWPNDGDEVIEIEVPSSHELFQAMADFTNCQSYTIACKLRLALEGKHPFARFKNTIKTLGVQEKWYAFQNKWYEDKAESWLRFAEVEVKDGKIVTSGEYITWNEVL